MNDSDSPTGPLSLRAVAGPALLGLAATAMVGPWRGGPVAEAVATLALLAAFGLASWRLGRGSDAVSPGAIDWSPLLERLDRLIAAVEARPSVSVTAGASGGDPEAVALAIAEKRWRDAESLILEHSDAAHLAERLARAKQEAGEGLAAELAAAQGVGDADRVLELHDGLAAVLPPESLDELDARVVKWFLALIMRRLRGGTVRADVAELAGRVADRFPRSVEGASLRASLPTLRRSAGLCPRCVQPYRGIADACPACLAPPPLPPPTLPPDDEPPVREDDDPFEAAVIGE